MSDGIAIQAYDKKVEIENKSNKRYILDYYGNPKNLYWLEVRLHYQELKDYFSRQYMVPTTEVILDGDLLTDMFLYHLGAVVRFTRGRRKSFGKTSLDVMSRVSITISPATAYYLSVRR